MSIILKKSPKASISKDDESYKDLIKLKENKNDDVYINKYCEYYVSMKEYFTTIH